MHLMDIMVPVCALNAQSGMSDDLIVGLISTAFTTLLTIVGFVVTFLSMRKSFKNELEKQNNTIKTNKLSELNNKIVELIGIYESSIKKGDERKLKLNKDKEERLSQAMGDLIFYGNEEMLSVLLYAREQKFDSPADWRIEQIVGYILVLAILKCEFTGEIINPKKFLALTIDHYEKNLEEYKKCNNEIVEKLNLKKEYLIE